MTRMLPDYKNCIANLPNSILKKFNVPTKGNTLPLLDSYLEKDFDNIVVLLLDGMGKSIIDRNLEKDGFFQSHLVGTYSSTFPPTTVAATTSISSGQMPNETGWLGWDCYYPQIDKNVTVFLNLLQGTKEAAESYHVANRFCPYEGVWDAINKAGGEGHYVLPFNPPYPDTFDKICDTIEDLCKKPGKRYVYAYWDQPDGIMHKKGCFGPEALSCIRELEEKVEELSHKLADTNTLLIITADHGHMDSTNLALEDYPSLMDCLIRMPSIEPRALNLFVKEEKKDFFVKEFQKTFGDSFELWTKEQVISSKLFGTGTNHPCFEGMLGDFLAIAVSDVSIFNTREEASHMVGVHAGLTEEEMVIPLILV